MPIRTSSAKLYNTSQILPLSVCIHRHLPHADSSSAVLVYRSLLYNMHITHLFKRRYPAYQLRTDLHQDLRLKPLTVVLMLLFINQL